MDSYSETLKFYRFVKMFAGLGFDQFWSIELALRIFKKRLMKEDFLKITAVALAKQDWSKLGYR